MQRQSEYHWRCFNLIYCFKKKTVMVQVVTVREVTEESRCWVWSPRIAAMTAVFRIDIRCFGSHEFQMRTLFFCPFTISFGILCYRNIYCALYLIKVGKNIKRLNFGRSGPSHIRRWHSMSSEYRRYEG